MEEMSKAMTDKGFKMTSYDIIAYAQKSQRADALDKALENAISRN